MQVVGVLVRKANLSDAGAVAACVDEAYRHYVPRIGKPPGPMLDDYGAVVREHQAFVAEHEGRIVGILVLIRGPGSILLDNVAVDPILQGKGLGKQLFVFAESEAGRQGFAHIDLYTHEPMAENIDFYKRIGYVEIERKTVKSYKHVYIRKQLEKTNG